jgi:hypothetical protein
MICVKTTGSAQRHDTRVDLRRAVEEGEPPDRCAHQRRRRHRHDDRPRRRERPLDIVGEREGHRIDADAEERRLAECQNARIAPEEVDRDRRDREEERLGEDLLRVVIENERARGQGRGQKRG